MAFCMDKHIVGGILFYKRISSLLPGFIEIPGPSYSKLMMSLVNDSLKFTSSDTQIC